MMAMKFFSNNIKLNKELEIDIWRESHLVAIRGTSRYGLALSTLRRGHSVKIISNSKDMGYVDVIKDIRTGIEKKLLNFFFKDIKQKCLKAGIKEAIRDFGVEESKKVLEEGGIPILLINIKFLSGENIAHWVLVKGFDRKYFYINNPMDQVNARKEKITVDIMEKSLGYNGKKYLIAVFPKQYP